VDSGRVGPVLEAARSSPVIAAWEGLIPLGWRFRRLVPEVLRGLARDRRVVVAHPTEGGLSEDRGVVVYARRDGTVILSWVDGPPHAQRAAVGWVVGRERPGRLVAFTPDTALASYFSLWHPHPWCPGGLVVVHKHLGS
jgi:hypothetical protein